MEYGSYMAKGGKIQMALDHIDKWMPDDFELQKEYYQLINDKDQKGMEQFLDMYADQDRLMRYGIQYEDLGKFSEAIISGSKYAKGGPTKKSESPKTVQEFFEWYYIDDAPNWYNDNDILYSMEIDGKPTYSLSSTQKKSALSFFKMNKNTSIKDYQEELDEDGNYTISFDLKGKKILIPYLDDKFSKGGSRKIKYTNEDMPSINEVKTKKIKKSETPITAKEFFNWYSRGYSNWYDDTTTLTFMKINGKEIRNWYNENNPKVKELLAFFKANKNAPIKNYKEELDDFSYYTISFDLKDKKITIEENKNTFSKKGYGKNNAYKEDFDDEDDYFAKGGRTSDIKDYLQTLESNQIFDLCNDFYYDDEEWHEIKNDLDKDDLIQYAYDYCKKNKISVKDLKDILGDSGSEYAKGGQTSNMKSKLNLKLLPYYSIAENINAVENLQIYDQDAFAFYNANDRCNVTINYNDASKSVIMYQEWDNGNMDDDEVSLSTFENYLSNTKMAEGGPTKTVIKKKMFDINDDEISEDIFEWAMENVPEEFEFEEDEEESFRNSEFEDVIDEINSRLNEYELSVDYEEDRIYVNIYKKETMAKGGKLPNPSNLYGLMIKDRETGYGTIADGKVYTINEALAEADKLDESNDLNDGLDTFVDVLSVEELLKRPTLPKSSKKIIYDNYKEKVKLMNYLIERFGTDSTDWQKDFAKGGATSDVMTIDVDANFGGDGAVDVKKHVAKIGKKFKIKIEPSGKSWNAATVEYKITGKKEDILNFLSDDSYDEDEFGMGYDNDEIEEFFPELFKYGGYMAEGGATSDIYVLGSNYEIQRPGIDDDDLAKALKKYKVQMYFIDSEGWVELIGEKNNIENLLKDPNVWSISSNELDELYLSKIKKYKETLSTNYDPSKYMRQYYKDLYSEEKYAKSGYMAAGEIKAPHKVVFFERKGKKGLTAATLEGESRNYTKEQIKEYLKKAGVDAYNLTFCNTREFDNRKYKEISGVYPQIGYMADGGDTDEPDAEMEKLVSEHNKEAKRNRVKITNFGWSQGEDFIVSKTTERKDGSDVLTSEISNGVVEHDWDSYKRGGKLKTNPAKFRDKVNAITKKLAGTKVPKKYKKDYGATYDKKEANTAAKRIAGAKLAEVRAKLAKKKK